MKLNNILFLKGEIGFETPTKIHLTMTSVVSLDVHLSNGDVFRIEEGKDGKILVTPVEEEKTIENENQIRTV